MCAPFVAENVRLELSRRGFIGVVAGGAAASMAPAAAQQKPVRLPKGFRDG